jgi:23S rRNA (uracil1939-C5)-methyltransferase
MQLNGVENVRYMRGRVEDKVGTITDPVDVLVLDPPRAGCLEAAVDAMAGLHPERIIYISCEPSTLARDLSRFSTGGRYTLSEVAFVDMFPQTFHIEAVAKLDRTA